MLYAFKFVVGYKMLLMLLDLFVYVYCGTLLNRLVLYTIFDRGKSRKNIQKILS